MKNKYILLILFFLFLVLASGFYWLKAKKLVDNQPISLSSVSLDDYDTQKALSMDNTVPVIVIGSGPAGLSAALWTARANYKTILFAGPKPGGLLTEVRAIENWPGRSKTTGLKAIDDLKAQAEQFGTQIIYDTVSKVDFSRWPFVIESEKGTQLNCLSAIIATGGTPKSLPIPGAKAYWSNGVGTCSVCDAPFTKGKKIIVVGGGDTSGDRALQFAAYAKKVVMTVREPELEACGTVQEYLKENPKIGFLFNTEIEEILGDGKKVIGVRVRNTKTGERKKVAIDGVYFAIGYKPNSEIFQKDLQLDEKGFIKRQDGSQKTSIEGIFTAGDVDDNRHRKAAVAAGNGVEASLDAMDFLQEIGFSPDVSKELNYPSFVEPDEVEIETVTTKKELQSVLKESAGLVLVDFYADYCSVCRALMPELNSLASEYKEKLKIIKVERVEQSDVLFNYFNITSVPYYIMFTNGRERSRAASISTPKDLRDFVGSFFVAKKAVGEKVG